MKRIGPALVILVSIIVFGSITGYIWWLTHRPAATKPAAVEVPVRSIECTWHAPKEVNLFEARMDFSGPLRTMGCQKPTPVTCANFAPEHSSFSVYVEYVTAEHDPIRSVCHQNGTGVVGTVTCEKDGKQLKVTPNVDTFASFERRDRCSFIVTVP